MAYYVFCYVMLTVLVSSTSKGSANTTTFKFASIMHPLNEFDGVNGQYGGYAVSKHVIGGINAEQNQWTWYVSLQVFDDNDGWSHTCGASLLTTTSVLCAAHCVIDSVASDFRVVAGIYNLGDTSNGQKSLVSQIIMHEGYMNYPTSATLANDIAILILKTPFTLTSNVQLLSLPPNNEGSFAGVTCKVVGWGRSDNRMQLTDNLQQADLGVISNSECQSLMSSLRSVYTWNKQMCLYDPNFKIAPCNGDSGGSLHCPDGRGGWYVAGIASWGMNEVVNGVACCLPDFPSIFTRTSCYLDWINAHMYS